MRHAKIVEALGHAVSSDLRDRLCTTPLIDNITLLCLRPRTTPALRYVNYQDNPQLKEQWPLHQKLRSKICPDNGSWYTTDSPLPRPQTSTAVKKLTHPRHQNKTLSDDPDPLLQLVRAPTSPLHLVPTTPHLTIPKQQGIGWFLRKAISLATITLTVTQYTDPAPRHHTHIDISQVATGGIGGTTEKRTLDWEERPHTDKIFGEVKGKSRWVDLEAFKSEGGKGEEFLKTGWLEEGVGEEKWRAVQSWVESPGGKWTAEQVCFFSWSWGGVSRVRKADGLGLLVGLGV